MSNFQSLQLIPSINSALKKKGYTTPTPIQAQAIPALMKGKDVLGIAQTGTGKTAAFSLPIIHRIAKKPLQVNKNHIRVLILTPTRELASQILDNIKTYSEGVQLKTAVIFGGVGKQPQINKVRKGLDILIATPGRLLDLTSEGHIKYSQIDTFILDEADRMLDMGFLNDVKKIIKKLPTQKQTLLFSATMEKNIEALATSLLKNPVKIEVTPDVITVDKIEQSLIQVNKKDKLKLLLNILEDQDIESCLVFSRTKHGADRIVKGLQKINIESAAIHGNKSQGARERALKSFKDSKIRVLVATDIAARGIDIPQVSHVINYNLPEDPENYVHRIGRTGRAGRDGISISFCDDSEISLLKSIERFIKLKISKDTHHPLYNENLVAAKEVPKTNRPKKKSFAGKGNRRKKKGTLKSRRRS
jgi:ATP-dependent RNA helicase RhlE